MNLCIHSAQPDEVVQCECTSEGVVVLTLDIASTFELIGGEEICRAIAALKDAGEEVGEGGGQDVFTGSGDHAAEVLQLRTELDETRERERSLILLNQEKEKRLEELANELMMLKGIIRVCGRVCPPRGKDVPLSVQILEDNTMYIEGYIRHFKLNKVFPHTTSQEDVFQYASEFIKSVVDGYKVI
ncbi:unnamed protein product [Closterium sp. Naga37s-1]|nr:unnamed protein product [Closterium sp. Naga37s-1]